MVRVNNGRGQKYKPSAIPFALASYLLHPKPLRPQLLRPHQPRRTIFHLLLAAHPQALRLLFRVPSSLLPQPLP